ncbi:hypothetical protein [Tabrizicola sp. YIM 78059]|uniref:hypothetical protein n=1 Tax=Tabrizicola sp. YIM 78059 TaxID=2529861 RepID=UPI0010AA1856|nr:hypothetical protein [Tabrizicola sp. YIM 78059]
MEHVPDETSGLLIGVNVLPPDALVWKLPCGPDTPTKPQDAICWFKEAPGQFPGFDNRSRKTDCT